MSRCVMSRSCGASVYSILQAYKIFFHSSHLAMKPYLVVEQSSFVLQSIHWKITLDCAATIIIILLYYMTLL